ncbi:MAG: MFS transporter [Alphaproteobacteria bacterium]|nr:MFS transporter [Alphaproteobacteria bacterium]
MEKNNPDERVSSFQAKAIIICMAINMLDGFDVLAIAFAAPGISVEWQVSAIDIGYLLSSGLIGMVLGSFLLAPMADKIGRRAIILLCLGIMSIGMFGSAISQDFNQMALTRLFTGIGIGGMLASLNTIVAEYSPDKWRGLAVSIMQTGYPIGATIGGAFAAYLVSLYDWRAIFFFGAAMSTIMIPVVLIGLPESLTFLLEKRPKGALEKVNKIYIKTGQRALLSLEKEGDAVRTEKISIFAMFSPDLRMRTFSLWTCFFMVMFTFYFLLSWTPKIMAELGAGEVGGIGSGIIMNIGGIVGAVALGYLSAIFSSLKLTASYMVLCVVSMIGFGLISTNMDMMLFFIFFMGFFIFGSMIGLYTQVPDIFPALIRTTGTGWAIGVGRFGAVLGPITAGILIEAEWSRLELFSVLGIPLLISTFVILRLVPGRH